MELIGTIKLVFDAQSGVSQSGKAYKRQMVVITYGDQYPKELALTLMNDRVDAYGIYLAPGLKLRFYFDASSREYNGRYYTDCVVWKIESAQPQAPQPQTMVQSTPMPTPMPTPQPIAPVAPQDVEPLPDDLPF